MSRLKVPFQWGSPHVLNCRSLVQRGSGAHPTEIGANPPVRWQTRA